MDLNTNLQGEQVMDINEIIDFLEQQDDWGTVKGDILIQVNQ